MLSIKEYIESGILEQYVFGTTTAAETEEIELMALTHPAIRAEIDAICETLEAHAVENAIEPGVVIKPLLLATINYLERLENGEQVIEPPLLNQHSAIEEYAPWLNRSDMVSPGTENIYARIISYTPAVTTAIIWVKDFTPPELHHSEYEKFLIVEGSCEIIVEDEVNILSAGDYFAIPLHKSHVVKVTSSVPCKLILQRSAA